MSKTVKVIKVKGVGVFGIEKKYLTHIETYGRHGDWEKKKHAEDSLLYEFQYPSRVPVDCTITFTIPQKGKRK